jgi:tRNA (cmo5U34)-methyltransferase
MTTEQDWSEDESRAFIDHGDCFVPHRGRVLASIAALIPQRNAPWTLLDLCCGEGLLTETVLREHPSCRAVGLDLSTTMLDAASRRLEPLGARFEARAFRLEDTAWRTYRNVWCIASSLAVHHLDGPGKRQLLVDCHRMLAPGGVMVLFDVMRHPRELAERVAARDWDAYVQGRSAEMTGSDAAWRTFVDDHWNMYAHPPQPGDIDQPSTLFEHLGWAAEAGFADIDVHSLEAGHALMSFSKPA